MRKVLLLLIGIISLIGLSGVSAQATPIQFCGDLAKADCELLTASSKAMQALQSAGMHFQLDFAMDGLPTTPRSVSFTLIGDGAFTVDSKRLSALGDPSKLTQNMQEFPKLVEEVFKAIAADVTLLLRFPDSLVNLASRSGSALPSKVGLSVRMVDGYGYVNLNKLAELDTSGTLPRGWYGIDLAGFYRRALEDQMGSLGALPNTNNLSADPQLLATYVKIERLADAQRAGQTLAVFKSTYDLGAAFANPTMQRMLRQQLEGNNAFRGMNMDQIMTMYERLFQGFVFDVTQHIGLEDKYVHQMTMKLDWKPDFSALAPLMGSSATASLPRLTFRMDLQAELNQFNQTPAITAPPNATIIPIDTLLPGRRTALLRPTA
jgi:hypothetical protein